MKKLLLLLSIVILESCKSQVTCDSQLYVIIQKIPTDNGYCLYQSYNGNNISNFKDDCNKYNVTDTIIFVKK